MIKKPRIYYYTPQPVYLPQGIERQPFPPIPERLRADWERKKSAFDSETLFYDVFFKDGKLICVGPPFANLGKPRSISHQGKRLKFRLEFNLSIDREPTVLLIECGNNRKGEFKLKFAQFTVTISHHCQEVLPLPKTDIVLITVQKDNPTIWIEDWINWHYKVHNIKRIIIYDNGSKQPPDFKHIGQQPNNDIEIVLVRWPYKYGFWIKDKPYQYCPTGALNHFRLAWGSTTRWCCNLDLDEYLDLNKKESLKHYLSQTVAKPVVALPSYIYPSPERQPIRFFYHQERLRKKTWVGAKYICQPQLTSMMRIHSIDTKNELKAIVKRFAPSFLYSLYLNAREVKRSIKSALTKLKKNNHNKQTNKEQASPLCFHHFRGLNTGWMNKEGREFVGISHGDSKDILKDIRYPSLAQTNPDKLTTDTTIIEKAKQVGMIPK